MKFQPTRPLVFAFGLMISALAVGMVASRPRPLLRIEAQTLIDRELCHGKSCPIESDAGIETESSDSGVGFSTLVTAPRENMLPTSPYGPPRGKSRYGVIGVASRTTLGWWWQSAVNIGIRPYSSPPNIVLVDDRYSARRIAWVRKNWDHVSNADLYAELYIARRTMETSREAGVMMVKLMGRPEPAHTRVIDSIY